MPPRVWCAPGILPAGGRIPQPYPSPHPRATPLRRPRLTSRTPHASRQFRADFHAIPTVMATRLIDQPRRCNVSTHP